MCHLCEERSYDISARRALCRAGRAQNEPTAGADDAKSCWLRSGGAARAALPRRPARRRRMNSIRSAWAFRRIQELCACKADAAMTLIDERFMGVVIASMKGGSTGRRRSRCLQYLCRQIEPDLQAELLRLPSRTGM